MNAVILAGDRGENGVPKALIKIASRYMVEYVIESLRNSGCINRVYIVGDKIIKEKVGHLVDGWVDSEGDILKNIKKGIHELGEYNKPCLICTCDIPMVKGEAIRDFALRCEALDIDVGYPIIDKKLNDEKYPEVKRTYVKMREGTFTGGNIIYINPQVVDKFTKKIEKFVEYRKKPFKMGRELGIIFLIKLVLGILSISSVELKVWKMFGIRGSAIITSYPEIGNDVDKPSDIEFVNKYLGDSA
ncbi:nucleotidyltransferase family protein [Fonticella tunisiensis]|uniref:MobA-like NTP transferase protein n=1 Tax=Fonticella tunisiensis TaxID=1096341 RepID=A0A4R7KVE1_9CLOT|nr:nucleotidyltransferase family protein [Fonticella tunisiensis]TDT62343.1 MobA-like NTP transferase protein [Fonticella tunisiensis]